MNSKVRDLPAWCISLVVNLGILGLLQLVVYETLENRPDYEISSVITEEQERIEEMVLDATLTDQVGTGHDSNSLVAPMQSAMMVGAETQPVAQRLPETVIPTINQFVADIPVAAQAEIASFLEVGGQLPDTEDAGGMEGALDRIAMEIHQSVRERQTLVVFVLDASLSMESKREAIAERIDTIYAQVENLGGTAGLHTAVVSFGENSNLLTEHPVQDPKLISEAVRAIQNDESGKENVFATLAQVVEEFKFHGRLDGRWNRLVFIITDERGDDADFLLEPVVNECLQFNFRCFVAGHAAIFGQQHGYVQYTYPEDGFVDYLPCDQGPETAFPQVLQIPFFGSGEDFRLQRMSAGYGPYALTRLCAETGGAYLITDDTQGFAFERHILRLYGPDYRPSREQEQEIMANPAKAALVQACAMTYSEAIPMPQTVFLHLNDNDLRRQLTDAQMPAARLDYQVNAILQTLKQGESGRASLDNEPRWAAAYDLAMGRAMAMRVRLYGYNLMLAQMKQAPLAFENPEQQNQWTLTPGPEIETGPQMRQAAEEARMYLSRVIDEHPDTPFARLAERELSTDMGWTWQPSYFPIPGLENRENLTEEEVMLLLAEEIDRRERERQTREARVPPRL